jgi:exosortase/archaeosortase family protein
MAKRASNVLVTTVRSSSVITKMLLVLSFLVPFLILYLLDPFLFERTWIGRTFYLFFLWLVVLEIILNGENLQKSKLKTVRSLRTVLFIVIVLMPTVYVVTANYFGLNAIIADFAQRNNMAYSNALLMRIPVEYLVFTLLFALMVILTYGIIGLRDFSISILFLGIIGTLYAIDTIYPGNTFAPFQVLVPATTQLSSAVLNLMGYYTSIDVRFNREYGNVPYLSASKQVSMQPSVVFGIAWACSGIESLLIYTVVIALFLKASEMGLIYKVACFVMGAFVTYFINILRVVSFFVIMLNGGTQQAFQEFHDYYGPLYSVLWIISYPLIIIGIHALWTRHTNTGSSAKQLTSVASQN